MVDGTSHSILKTYANTWQGYSILKTQILQKNTSIFTCNFLKSIQKPLILHKINDKKDYNAS